MILVSDGDELEGDSSERLDEFKERGIPVIAVGAYLSKEKKRRPKKEFF